MSNHTNRTQGGRQRKKSRAEITGILLIIFSAFFLICLIFPIALSVIGAGVRNLLTGILGAFAFALFSGTTALGILLLKGKRLAVTKKRVVLISLISAFGLMILQLITTHSLLSLGFGEHLAEVYNFSYNFSIGGVIFSFFTMAVVATTGVVVAYLFYVALFLIFAGVLATDIIKFNKPVGENKRKYNKSRIMKKGSKEYVIQSDGSLNLENTTNYGLYVGKITPHSFKNKEYRGEFRDLEVVDEARYRVDNASSKGTGSGDVLSDYFGIQRDKETDNRSIDSEGDREKARDMLLGDWEKRGIEDTERFKGNLNTQKEMQRVSDMTGVIQAEPMIERGTEFKGYDSSIYVDDLINRAKTGQVVKEEPPVIKKSKNNRAETALPPLVFPPPIDQQSLFNDEGGIINGAEYSRYIASTIEKKEDTKKEAPEAPKEALGAATSGVSFAYETANENLDSFIENADNYNNTEIFDDLKQRADAIAANMPSFVQAPPNINHADNSGIINASDTASVLNTSSNRTTAASVTQIVPPTVVTNPFAGLNSSASVDTLVFDDADIENASDTKIEIDIEKIANTQDNKAASAPVASPTPVSPSSSTSSTTTTQQHTQEIREENFEFSKSNFTPKIDREFIAPGYEDDESELKTTVLKNIKTTLNTISSQLEKDNTQTAVASQIINNTLDILDSSDIEEKTQTTTQSINLSFASKLKNKSHNQEEEHNTIYLDQSEEDTMGNNLDIEDTDDNAPMAAPSSMHYGTTPYKQAQKQDEELQSIFDQDEDYTGAYIRGHDSKPKEFSKRNAHHKIPVNQIHIDDALKTNAPKALAKPNKKSSKYIKPPVDLLTADSTDPSLFGCDSDANKIKLEQVLDSLGLKVQVTSVSSGPAVTRYELTMPVGTPVSKILSFAKDIAYELAAKKGVRIEAPISGKRAVGVEVPNQEIGIVSLKDLIGSPEFANSSSNATLCLGKDIAGGIVLGALEKMPHLLVAGTTGSGKSACLNSLIVSMIYKSSPADLRLILIDPKRVEFPQYASLPHLLINKIINEREHAINAFKWVISEMNERYKLLAEYKAKNIQDFNNTEAVKTGQTAKLPRIVIVVDELSDLMSGGYKKEMESLILSIAQLSRAAGINMILATQRPSVDIITGTIRANLPSRIAFAVQNGTDSRTILDQTGAEMLLGRGDSLYSPIDAPEPKRIQGAYVTSEEVEEIVKFICENNTADYFDEAAGIILKDKEAEASEDDYSGDDNDNSGFDPMLEEIARRMIETGEISTSLLQRRYKVGYARGARIMDDLEQLGFIGGKDAMRPTKPREIYATREMFEKVFGVEC